MRVQRARSWPSARRSPLTCRPLGAVYWSLVGGLSLAAVVVVGCASSTTYSGAASVQGLDVSAVRCVLVKVSAADPRQESEILHRLMGDLEAALPDLSFTTVKSLADLEIEFQRDDWIICVDCDETAYRTQYWNWSLSISRPEFNAKCDTYESKFVGWLAGETWKLGERPEEAAAREFRSLMLRKARGA